MPAQKRKKTKYAGVTYIEGTSATGKPEKIYYIRYRKNGKLIEERAGRQFKDDMTPARASTLRGKRIYGTEPTNKEKRAEEVAKKKEEENRWTIDRLWEEYKKSRTPNKALKTDEGRYEKYIKPDIGDKEPTKLVALDIDRIKRRLLKKLSPQTVKHVLNLIKWITNFGIKKGLAPGFSFAIENPTVNNEKIEDVTPEQLTALMEAIEKDTHIMAKNMMKLALFSGMRRGEMFKLQWNDVNFHRKFIHLRDPKGKKNQKIPLNDAARAVLENHPRSKSPHVFHGRDGKPIVDIRKAVNKIRDAAGLSKDFRALHGLRHVYASMLASSGQVDMYTLQKLLTHKSSAMTLRYVHLRDEALQKAARLAGDIITQAMNGNKEEKVVNLDDSKK